MNERAGKIRIPAGADVWPHELLSARALASAGHDIEFIPKSTVPYHRTPDVLVDNIAYEMKSPTSPKLTNIRKTLRKALAQSNNVIFDSMRMKSTPDYLVERELEKQAEAIRSLRSLVFINKKREVIDIK